MKEAILLNGPTNNTGGSVQTSVQVSNAASPEPKLPRAFNFKKTYEGLQHSSYYQLNQLNMVRLKLN